MNIDAVEQRSGNALAVSLDLIWRAAAFAFGVTEITARARIEAPVTKAPAAINRQ
jgi:hypothetical protein